MTSPVAALLDFSASLHAKAPSGLPTPSRVLRSLAGAGPGAGVGSFHPSSFDALANAVSIPPIHVDHVGEAVALAADVATDVRGPLGVKEMRDLIGWYHKGKVPLEKASEATTNVS